MQTSPPVTQRFRDIDVLACLLEGRSARIQSAEIDPVDGLVVFSVEILLPEQAERIAASFARRELMVNAKVFSAIQREIHRRIRDVRSAQVPR
jgi:hypothetical protein